MKQAPPFSQSADRNKSAILRQLQAIIFPGFRVLEIASGTGQHAIHFAQRMPNVLWQASDRDLHEYALEETIAEARLPNLPAPVKLDATDWPQFEEPFDAVYSANCIHVMPAENLEPYIAGAASNLRPKGTMMLYGPFRYGEAYTSESNATFDAFLRETYQDGGIRDFEEVDALARRNGLALVSDTDMPANNQLIVWARLL